MLVTTTETVPGKRIAKVVGLVKGNSIRCRDLGHDILAELKNMVGGEIADYTKMMAECREEALDRMMAQAHANGANAVVAMRFTTCEMMQHSAELLAYGTGVVLEDIVD